MDRKTSPVVTDKTQHTMQAQRLDQRVPSPSTAQVLGEFSHTQVRLEVKFARGGLNVITGDTGSGKTSLLHSLLLGGSANQGIIGLSKAQFEPIAYASQEAWLFRGSIKDNIVFGTAYDQKRYERVIRDCALEKDLAAFKDGDLKEVGEGGRSLSGGQRQRVSLARAMYTNANVVILDDILSGLDPSTFEWVVTKCISRSEQQNRTMIMVTNSQRILQMADLVIQMENGRIAQIKNISTESTQDVPDKDYVGHLFHDTPEIPEIVSATPESTGGRDEMSPVSAEAPNEGADFQRVSSLRYGFKYIRSFGSRPFVTLAVISTVGAQALEIGLPAWLSMWSAISVRNEGEGLGSAQIAILAVSLLLLYSGAWRSSRDKHMEMISAIFGTTYTWIWSTQVGEVINRFSSDIASLDDTLFRTFRPVLETWLAIGLRILTVTSLIPLFFLPSVVLCGFAIYVGYQYSFAATAVKHLYAASLTPLHHSIAETASGLKTIHAFRAQAMLQKRFNAALEHHVQAWNAVSDLQRWLAVRMDIFVALISCSAATLAVLRPHSSAPVVGLSLTLTTGLCTALLYLVYLSSLLEVEMASYRRIENYIQELPQEVSSPNLDACAVEHWPTRGLISIKNFGASYALDEKEVLKGVNYRANAGQRTAIVGRTGSGKTSLALSLLRLTTRTRGSISIDGVDIEAVPVEKLRQSISFIPQDPTLLDGTIRFNLDFNGEYAEGYLQSILDDVAGTRKWKLDETVELNGRNFSQGERQLITLARAMVSKHKILIIDEGTASLDRSSEDRIMAVLRDRFSECDGQMLEAGNPRQLLGGENVFKALYLQQCGTDAVCRRINLPCEGYAQRITFKDQTKLIVARVTGKPAGRKGQSSTPKDEEDDEANSTLPSSIGRKPISPRGPPSPPSSEYTESCSPMELKQENTKTNFRRGPDTPTNPDLETYSEIKPDQRHSVPAWPDVLDTVSDSFKVMHNGYLTPHSPMSARTGLSPRRILFNSSLSLLGAFEFPEDYMYYEYSANGHLLGLLKVLPLPEILKSQPMSHHVYNAAMALAALTMSSFEPYSRGSIKLRRHAFHHSLKAIQGLNAELSSSSAAKTAVQSWNYDRILSLFATTMLLANFELQRGALLAWRSHMQGAALCLNTGYKQLRQTLAGMLLIRSFARMALLLRLYNKDYSVTSPETMPTRLSQWLDLLLKQSSQLQDRMLLLVEEVTALEIQKRQEPELDTFWSSKSSELLCKLDEWRTDVPIDEVPVDDDISGAYLTISSSDHASLIRVSALVFPNTRDPCTSAVNYVAYLCTCMRARTRYLPDSGRIVPPDAERTALTICRIAAGIPPTRFGESFTHSYGMLPSVVGAYRWSTNPGLRNWIKHWLAGYRGPREGIWNVQQTLKLLATMDSLPKPGWHFIALKVIDEPQEPSPDLDEAQSNEPFKVVLQARVQNATSTNVFVVK
ncbi:hypothetical protein KXV92_005385 [Aspergillus fumigatus]|nr:hypothetical protein KXX42_000819 [Aspergillus fumigatus]KAH2319766.1 hypothetical protein KXV47_003908 [Aspergillus fumigatus]KAH2754817.1 hypothetical protein KXV94_000894 [Aspergillus fumigatus]KAH2921268.1 hypothetical protein KXW25_002267 [Aspergillus fumigatus]KAH3209975.1 hypothetical protein KXV92_005385 [Aspergillus fumigatus]